MFLFFLSRSRDIYDIFGKKVVSCDGLGGLVYFRSREQCKSCAFGALLFTFFLLLVTSFCYSGYFVVYPLVGIGYPYSEE